MAIAQVADEGLDRWLGAAISSPELAGDAPDNRDVVRRGLGELDSFLKTFKIQ
jgi:hypothetical protein